MTRPPWPLVTPSNHGQVFIAIDPSLITGPEPFSRGMDEMIDGVKASPVVEGGDPLMMPGEIEHRKRTDALQGEIPLGDDVVESLRVAATEASVPLPSSLT